MKSQLTATINSGSVAIYRPPVLKAITKIKLRICMDILWLSLEATAVLPEPFQPQNFIETFYGHFL